MNNSIYLPLPEFAAEATELTRCFVVWRTGEIREVASYPFEPYIIEQLLTARDWAKKLNMDAEFTTTLFFPESWPPHIIKDFLNEPVPSVDTGIHLPIRSLIDENRVLTSTFVYGNFGWEERVSEPFTHEQVRFMMNWTAELDAEYQYEPSWCLVQWFPDNWPPDAIQNWLAAEAVQGSFFPF